LSVKRQQGGKKKGIYAGTDIGGEAMTIRWETKKGLPIWGTQGGVEMGAGGEKKQVARTVRVSKKKM